VTMRRYRIVHTTELVYPVPVRASHNELRMTPVNEPGQTTLENRIRVRPMTWSHVYRDHWGTHVTAMESLAAHDRIDIEAISTVERSDPEPLDDPLPWSALQDEEARDRSFEWLMLTSRTEAGPGLTELADEVRSEATPREATYALSERIHDAMVYESGVTGVHSSGEEAWKDRRGVCQDFAHITLGALRALGIPSRYVSGYLAPTRDGTVGETSIGESHAWVEFWDGSWLAIDPTNRTPVGADHVVVARGRDYEDVPPFKGVYSGTATASLSVEVRFTRLT
jgi:transglutaminase-like putative cysteine protease